MIPSYDRLDDTRLEEVLRERAFHDGADLWVGRVAEKRWRAAFRVYGPVVGRLQEFIESQSAVGKTRRKALVALAQIDDIGTV